MDLIAPAIIGLHLVSMHLPAHDGQENFNPGIYARWQNGVTVGTYHNTLGRQTVYAGWTAERGPFSLTLGIASGYQSTRTPVPCASIQRSGEGCYWDSPGVRSALVPMVAPSVALPTVAGFTPRLSYIPGLAGSSNVFHLSLEHPF